MNKIISFIALLLISITSYGNTNAHALGDASNPIRVGVSEGAPFAYFDQKKPTGFAVKLWETIAKEKNWHYTFVPMGENIESAITAVKHNELDILIGPVSVTHNRIQHVDYARPYYINQISLATKTKEASPLLAIERVIDYFKQTDILIILGIIFIFCNVIWFSEVKKTPGHRAQNYFQGIAYALWISLAQLLHGNSFLESKEPRSAITRIVCMIWFLCALIILTLITSSVTAFIAKDLLHATSTVQRASDLTGKRLGYVAGSRDITYIQSAQAFPVKFSHLSQALMQLKDGSIDGVIDDHMILKNEIAKHGLHHVIQISHFTFANDEFAFALPYGSALLRPMNYEIVKLQDNRDMFFICSRFLGHNAKDCQL